ncbi:MAG TPA: serine hydrolase domain-containing protein [Saprospiraceae bacterium]|nr:serine hydrolase domain-containing protein [Saprospiraceae bacterium]
MRQLIVLLGVYSLTIAGFAQTSADISSHLDKRLLESAANGWSGSALVVAGGKILLEKGYGFADRQSKKLQTPKTVFSIGSITKQFTAAGDTETRKHGIAFIGRSSVKVL